MNNSQPDSNRNFLIAMVAFIAIMFVSNRIFEGGQGTPEESAVVEPAKTEVALADALSKSSRIRIENDKLYGTVDLDGGVIDNIFLRGYKETTEANSPDVMLLAPRMTHSEYYYTISYKDRSNNEEIADNKAWTQVVGDNIKDGITIETKTNSGLVVRRTVTIDGYVIRINDKIMNTSDRDVNVSTSADLIRSNPKSGDRAVVHDGLVCNIDGGVEEIKYADIGKNTIFNNCEWFGYTDIYWLCSLVNTDRSAVTSCSKIGKSSYKCSVHPENDLQIKAGSEVDLSYLMFAGPKDIRILQEYSNKLGLHKLDMSIDFGWFFMVTKPLLWTFGFLGDLCGSMWIVILLLTLIFKIATYPLTRKSFVSIARMREVQPKIAALQKMYANNKARLNQELIAIYSKEKISPLSGCLPMLLQAPIFFCLYKVFYISIEMRHAPFFGWVHDLSSPDTAYIFNLFGAIDWVPPGILQIGVWPLIMGVTMFVQQRMSSSINRKEKTERTAEQKAQERMMLIMPVMFTYICASCPVGVVVYWTISNVFSMVQQHYVNKYVNSKS
jgi:YidC/Oxa1 family membrane protein insertase